MDRNKLKEILNPRDRAILDAQTGSSWVPREPADVILPYIEEEDDTVDLTTVEGKRKKAKEVYDGYGKVIDTCQTMKTEIEERCKDVVIDLNPVEHLHIISAVKRVFGTDGRQITFEMYKKCIENLSRISNDNIPTPGEK